MAELTVLRTSIETFTGPNNKRVDLVGMVHVADPGYYDIIQDFADTRAAEGAMVHYERMRRPTDEELRCMPDDVQDSIRFEYWVEQQTNAILAGTGLVRQLDEMQYRPEWENHDMSFADYVRGADPQKQAELKSALPILSLIAQFAGPEGRRHMVLSQLQEKITDPSRTPDSAAPVDDSVTLDMRTGIALKAMDNHEIENPGAPLVWLWGEAHVPGFRAGLWERKFKMVKRQLVAAARY